MTRLFRDTGSSVPATVIQAGPCTIVQIKTRERDGYQAVQIGFGVKKNATKAERNHAGGSSTPATLREVQVDDLKDLEKGKTLDVSQFQVGEFVVIRGTSKGKGFQGVMKRHGFKGGPKTHGQKDQMRMPGSIGATGPQRVLRGTRMAGRLGGEGVTMKNMEILDVKPEERLLVVKGSVPGSRSSLVLIESV